MVKWAGGAGFELWGVHAHHGKDDESAVAAAEVMSSGIDDGGGGRCRIGGEAAE